MSALAKVNGSRSFLDPFFAPFRRASRGGPSSTIGVGGTAVFGGFLQTNEKDVDLQGVERYRTFSEFLVNVAIVGAGVRSYLNLLSKASWSFEPADDSPEAEELAEKVEEILFDMTTPWNRVVRRAGMYRLYGYSVQEWTATKREDGSIGFLDVEPRPQVTIERWDLDESGTVHGMIQRSPQTQQEIYLPRGKVLYIVDDSLNDSPEGLGLFRHIVDTVKRLQQLQKLEGIGFETDLRGIPVGRGPFEDLQKMVDNGELTADKKASYELGLSTFISKHVKTENLGILLDSKTYESTDDKRTPSNVRQWDVDLLTSDSTSQEALASAIERMNREIARVLGVEHLLLGERGAGSLALSRDKSHNAALMVDSSLREVGESITSDLIGALFDLNGWDRDLMPKAKPEAVQFRDVEQITGALRDLSQASSAIGPQDEAFMQVFDLLGLQRPNLEDLAINVALTDPQPNDEVPDPEQQSEDTGEAEVPAAETQEE